MNKVSFKLPLPLDEHAATIEMCQEGRYFKITTKEIKREREVEDNTLGVVTRVRKRRETFQLTPTLSQGRIVYEIEQ